MADYEQSIKEIENSKKRLLLMGKDRKSKSRVAMKFRFSNDMALDKDNDVQQEQNKISKDLITTTNNFENVEETGVDVKGCVDDPQQFAVAKKSIIQSDASPNFDENICDLNDSFLIPFHRTEDYLIGQKESIELLSSICSALGTSNQTPINQSRSSVCKSSVQLLNITNSENISLKSFSGVTQEASSTFTFCSSPKRSESPVYDPSVTSKELASHSEFYNIIDDNNDSKVTHDDNSMADLNKPHLQVNKQLQGDVDDDVDVDTGEEGESGQNQSEADVQSISTIVELMDALSDNLDFEDIAVSILEENNADDILDNDAYKNKDDGSVDEVFDDSNNNSTVDGSQSQLKNCLRGPFLSNECLNCPNPSSENVSQISRKIKSSILMSDIAVVDAKNNADYRIRSDSTIFEEKEKESYGLNHLLEIYKPEVMILPQIPMLKMPENNQNRIKFKVDQSIQTDESLSGLPTGPSDFCAATTQSKDRSPSQSDRELVDIKGGKESRSQGGDFIGQPRDKLECSQEAQQLGRSFKKLDSPLLQCQSDSQSFRKDSRIVNSPDFGRSTSLTTETMRPFSQLDLPNQEELNRWRLKELNELEKKRQEIMDMCPRNTELLYLRQKEKDLKSRLKKVVQRRKALENLKPSDTKLELTDASSLDGLGSSLRSQGRSDDKSDLLSRHERSSPSNSLVNSNGNNRNFSFVNCFDYPKSRDQKSCTSGDSFCFPSTELCLSECSESGESSSNGVELTARLASIEISTSSPGPSEPKRKAAFDKLCLLLGPVVKGYIVRRLFKCHKVKEIIKNLMDIAKEVIAVLPVINSQDCSSKDRKFFELLDKQLSSNFNELQQIFIGPSRERMEILANQRAIERKKIFKKTPPKEKKLSYATKKTIERKKKFEELNSNAPPASQSSIDAPSTCRSDGSISLNAVPPTFVVRSASSYQIENSKGFVHKAHSSSQSAGGKNAKCSGQTLRSKFSSISKKPALSKNNQMHLDSLRSKPTGFKHRPFPNGKG